ncbi:MAG TPA: DUF3047 domain-containing protein [Nitrospiria bacterium]
MTSEALVLSYYRSGAIFLAAVALLVFGRMGLSEETAGYPEYVVDRFSETALENGLPAGWEPLTFEKVPRHTAYTLEPHEDDYCIKAESRDSASGLMRRLEIDPEQYPVLSWRWKVEGTIPGGNVASKKSDDYAARIYVTFKYEPERAGGWERFKYGTYKTLYGEYPPKASLNYFWANTLAKGGSTWSPYSKRSRMIAVESGAEGVGEWLTEEVNVLDDYRIFFGEDPPPIQGIAIMTDSDNTHTSATAYYDDIVFRGE